MEVQLFDILGFDEKFIFNNHGTQQSQSAYAYFNSTLSEKEKELYENQIRALETENLYLKGVIDKLLVGKE